jgi:hypothetical protein
MFIYDSNGAVVRPQQRERIRQRVHQPTLVKQQQTNTNKTQFYQSCWFWIFLILLIIAIFFCFNNHKSEMKPSFGYYF